MASEVKALREEKLVDSETNGGRMRCFLIEKVKGEPAPNSGNPAPAVSGVDPKPRENTW
jgi:hypothetical protein